MAADTLEDPRPPRNVAPQDAHLVEERSGSERVFSGKLLDVRRDTVQLSDGHIATREYIVHPGAVLIVPMQDDGRVVVVRQFRYPNNAVFIEFPAGKRDPASRRWRPPSANCERRPATRRRPGRIWGACIRSSRTRPRRSSSTSRKA